MNTIGAIEEMKSYAENSWGGLSEAFEAAISALEKQTPKTVVEFEKYEFKCPCCNKILGIEKEDIFIYDMTPPKHCDNCGQMLDWDYWT